MGCFELDMKNEVIVSLGNGKAEMATNSGAIYDTRTRNRPYFRI